MDKCMLCGKTYQYPNGLANILRLNWIDRALTVCVCDDCYEHMSEYDCPKCGLPIFIETDPDLAKEYSYVCAGCQENFYGFEVE